MGVLQSQQGPRGKNRALQHTPMFKFAHVYWTTIASSSRSSAASPASMYAGSGAQRLSRCTIVGLSAAASVAASRPRTAAGQPGEARAALAVTRA